MILLGSILLSLPLANRGETTSYLNHLFVATSASCVTGLVPFPVANQYTLFGQIVIILLIQVGGLGFLTFLMLLFVFAKKRVSFSSRLLIQEALNKTNLDHLPEFIAKIFKYTLFCEGIGAFFLSLVFIPKYGFSQGLYYSIFHAISAFCNAGFDVLGTSSLEIFANNSIVLLTICALIIMGGIGFVVAFEFQEKLKTKKSLKHFWRSLSLHTKLVLVLTAILLISGMLLVYIFERNNPETIGNMSFSNQMLNAFFQSTTYRTAGFASFNQGAMKEQSKLIACLIMFIGGSPAGTAGGIKTVTLGVIYLSVRAVVKGRKQIVAFSRKINDDYVRRALAVVFISVTIVIGASFLLCVIEPYGMIDIFFECFSAFATVGLTANLTPLLSNISKMILIILMFIGRIGPITMVLSFVRRTRNNLENEIGYAEGELLIG